MSEITQHRSFFVCPNCDAQQELTFSLEIEKKPLHLEEFRHLKENIKDGDERIKELEQKVSELEEHLDDATGGYQRQALELLELEEELKVWKKNAMAQQKDLEE